MTNDWARSATRWLALVAFLILAALYLNSAMYSAWLSSGPPTDYPEGWMRRAQGQLCFAIAAALMGGAMFRLIGAFPKIDRIGAVVAIVGVFFVALPYAGRAIIAASCERNGGTWSSEALQCK